MVRRHHGWERIGGVAPAGSALSARRQAELALLAAWQRSAGQPLATHVVPAIERECLILKVDDPIWQRAVADSARELAAGVALQLEALRAYRVVDADGATIAEGTISARAKAEVRRRHHGQPLHTIEPERQKEPQLSADERDARLEQLRRRYLERSED